jgi:hypothetical protein
MLTWALMWYGVRMKIELNGIHVFFALCFDTIILVAFSAIWWSKYIK